MTVGDAEKRTVTTPTGHGPDDGTAKQDVVSDPALDDRVGSDWTDEGGASPVGPATDADPESRGRHAAE